MLLPMSMVLGARVVRGLISTALIAAAARLVWPQLAEMSLSGFLGALSGVRLYGRTDLSGSQAAVVALLTGLGDWPVSSSALFILLPP